MGCYIYALYMNEKLKFLTSIQIWPAVWLLPCPKSSFPTPTPIIEPTTQAKWTIGMSFHLQH